MPRLVFLVILSIILLSTDPSITEGQPSIKPAKLAKDKHKITVQTKLAHNSLHAGSTSMAALIVSVREGWHINSSNPGDENMIETTVDLDSTGILDSVQIHFPPGFAKQFEFSESPIEVYEGVVHMLLKFRVGASVKAGKYPIYARIGYQACSDNICLAPTTVSAEFMVHVVPPTKPIARINNELFDMYRPTKPNQE